MKNARLYVPKIQSLYAIFFDGKNEKELIEFVGEYHDIVRAEMADIKKLMFLDADDKLIAVALEGCYTIKHMHGQFEMMGEQEFKSRYEIVPTWDDLRNNLFRAEHNVYV